MEQVTIKAVLFDFGGVLANEGFREGLNHIARVNALNPGDFFATARELIYSTGYIHGSCSEAFYWDQLRMHTGIHTADRELRSVIFDHFILRDWMVDLVRVLKEHSVRVAILSDQTNWLDEMDQRDHFSVLFEQVFNSYHLGKSKSDPSLFTDVLLLMGLSPREALFVDDTRGNIERALSMGLNTIYFADKAQVLSEIQLFFPGVELPR